MGLNLCKAEEVAADRTAMDPGPTDPAALGGALGVGRGVGSMSSDMLVLQEPQSSRDFSFRGLRPEALRRLSRLEVACLRVCVRECMLECLKI